MKYEINDHVVITTAPDNKMHKVVSRHSNVYGLDNGKFYLGRELRYPTHGEVIKQTLEIGDRFYFFNNMVGSTIVDVGYKAVFSKYDMGRIICQHGLGFLCHEVKPIITMRAGIGRTV